VDRLRGVSLHLYVPGAPFPLPGYEITPFTEHIDNLIYMAPPIELNATELAAGGEVFEGPEKKLEVFFSTGTNADGFRHFDQATWSHLLVAASCSILHRESNEDFDAYLLSESSLFVYPSRVILKTCGTTGLLLVLPQLLELAQRLGVSVEHVHYGRYRYKFPEQQLYPHSSFEQEREYLARTFGHVEARVLGPEGGRCWYALVAGPPLAPTTSPRDGDDLFEIAMEGLAPEVCRQFVGTSHPGLEGRALPQHMTAVSGIGALLPGVTVDDWAFEPCGYSMNGLRGAYYYTIHITPEEGFSYASFETNDPQYRQPKWLSAVLAVFRPEVLTVTLTTRRVAPKLPAYALGGFERHSLELAELGAGVSMCCINFSEEDDDTDGASRKRKLEPASAPSPVNNLSAALAASSDSEGASSEVEASSEVSSVAGEAFEGPEATVVGGADMVAAC